MSPAGRLRAWCLLLALVALTALVLRGPAPSNDPADRLRSELGLDAEQARCATDRLRRLLPPSSLDALASEGLAGVPTGERDAVMLITTGCSMGDPGAAP